MKFIFNFIFFGLLFFVINHYFPEAFSSLVKGADTVFHYLRDLGAALMDKLNALMSNSSSHSTPS